MMKNTDLAKRVKDLRNRSGMSQELLAENSGLSLRTIQRIESGESEPRGNTLKRLSAILKVTPGEIMDWAVIEDNSFLAILNLSALGFILFPLLGILFPLIMWISRKDKLKSINKIGKEVLNFQISWTILILMTYLYFFGSAFYRLQNSHEITLSLMGNFAFMYLVFGLLYLYNLVLVIVNTIKIKNNGEANYYPKVTFLR